MKLLLCLGGVFKNKPIKLLVMLYKRKFYVLAVKETDTQARLLWFLEDRYNDFPTQRAKSVMYLTKTWVEAFDARPIPPEEVATAVIAAQKFTEHWSVGVVDKCETE